MLSVDTPIDLSLGTMSMGSSETAFTAVSAIYYTYSSEDCAYFVDLFDL